MSTQQTRIIVLERGEHLDTVIRKLEKGWIVQFKRGSSLLGEDVRVVTTITGNTPLQWSAGSDHLSVYCQVECRTAGAFKYSFCIGESEKAEGSGYLLVMPQLTCNDSDVPLDSIVCQTYLTKLLGDIDSWKDRLRVSKESGYNMIHLTPIHQLGVSNSSYSLSDHHSLNDTLNNSKGKAATFEDVHALVKQLESEWGMLTVQDVVWNHAAKNAKWLLEHPESAYNCLNSPHLRPAYVIDRILHHFGVEISEGVWEHRGLPPVIDNIHHINTMEYLLRAEVLPKARLHEFFQVDAESVVKTFTEAIEKTSGPTDEPLDEHLTIEQDLEWKRFGSRVDNAKALRIFNRYRGDANGEEERKLRCIASYRDHIEDLNVKAGEHAWSIIMSGLNAIIGHVSYERVADHGPKKGRVTADNPLTTDYFLHLEPDSNWEEEEKLAFDSDKARFIMAFNGWVMSNNPLANFALPDSQVYLRRELVCWGDSVKLNYGDGPEDSPFLWNYMETYTKKCAEIFHGLRIDNAHGTPIHVAERLLHTARQVKSDIYVFAELFTGSEQLDNLFVNRLGISSLIREAQSAGDSHEQGRLVYRYGGDCVGAMTQKNCRLASESIAHGLFLDQSHDNPSPIHTRSVYDLLPTAAMLAMASCAVGSTRGYDELVRHAIHVVTEERPYSSWKSESEVSSAKGIIAARRKVNELHSWLAKNGYSEVFVDQVSPDVVAITRHNPASRETVVLVAHTAFNKNYANSVHGLKRLPVGGVLEKVLFELKLIETYPTWEAEDKRVLIGLSNYETQVKSDLQPEQGTMFRLHGGNFIELTEFPSGAVVAFKIRPTDEAKAALGQIQKTLNGALDKEINSALTRLTLQQLNHVLFSCEAEDHATIGQGGYDVPNFGKFVYAGLQGLIPVLNKIRINNDLGHPLCQNLRDGVWLCDYIVARLTKFGGGVEKIALLVSEALAPLTNVPYYLRPCYFEAIIGHLYRNVRESLLGKLSSDVTSQSALLSHLAVSTVSFVGDVPGAGLAPLPKTLAIQDSRPSSLAAGLPHFAVGIWRNWGRDTFIALPGTLLLTGRFDDARNIILSFAGAMRHGLIPNLLAEGIGARYNCRDAVWFWLLSIVKYVEEANPDILNATVRRIYPNDGTQYGAEEREEPLIETIYEALDRHFDGIEYRERNAGHQIDEQMRDEGFNVSAFVEKSTGLIKGGNRWNCGTWMDKMGSSEKASNKGEPATPRDGAAVELQGLAYKVLTTMASWSQKGIIKRTHVKSDPSWTWDAWAAKLKSSFETHFYVDENTADKHVNRKHIVKDTVGSSLQFTDYQLRPNFAIALAVAPDLLDAEKAWKSLDTAKVLLGPIGIKTLDPTDWAYDGHYNNEDDGTEKKTAKGWNYHQGPEWLWVAAFYLSARLAIGEKLGGERLQEAIHEVQVRMGNYYNHLMSSPWRSLPELTNKDGSFCAGSCPAQAWSVACLIEASVKLAQLTK